MQTGVRQVVFRYTSLRLKLTAVGKKTENPKPTVLIANYLSVSVCLPNLVVDHGRLNNNVERLPIYTWGRPFFSSPVAVTSKG